MTSLIANRCDFNPGDVVDDRYHVVKTLGEGSFGKVYRVRDSQGRDRALKILRLWEVPPDVREPLLERFDMEYKTGQIDCDYLVRSLAQGRVQGNPYIVMEFCSGGDLTPLVGSGNALITLVCQQVLAGLHALHARGKVHRDLKPENVLFKGPNHAALTDFGIAGDRHRRLTERNIFGKPQQMFGTYAYMAPEQANRRRGDCTVLPTTDIFSFGVLAYQLLTGAFPFGPLTDHSELAQYLRRAKEGNWHRSLLHRVSNAGAWEHVIEGCLAPDFRRRLQTAEEVLQLIPNAEGASVELPRAYVPPPVVKGWCLRVMQGEECGRVYPLSALVANGRRLLTIGRDAANALPLSEQHSNYISRRHATLETDATAHIWLLRDGQWHPESLTWERSRNGTFIGSTPLDERGQVLRPGDIISIGEAKLRIENI